VAIVNGTPWSEEAAEGIADGVLVRERLVSRFEVGLIPSTISASQSWVISFLSSAVRIPRGA
jgi:hypothetical protein